MLTVKEIMTREVCTVHEETDLKELAALFVEHNYKTLPVVDSAGKLVGVVSQTDLIEQDKSLHIPTVISLFDWVIYLESDKKFEKELKKVTGQTVGDICTEDVLTVTPGDPVSRAADIMTGQRVNAVPVVDGKKLVGIISRIDLIRTMNS